MDDFEQFWAAYPRKVAKAEARKAWKQTQAVRPDIAKLLSSIVSACKTEQWMRGNGQFIPHAATWLRGERWEDDYEIKLPDVVNEKPWNETWAGIVEKGKELGILESQFEQPYLFKAAVLRAAMKVA